MGVIERQLMQIDREPLVELRNLNEDVAGFFCDENRISGETYWTCVQALAEMKLMELRGDLVIVD